MLRLIFSIHFIFLSFLILAQSHNVLIPYKGKNNKWGYADVNRKIIIPLKYDESRIFENGIGKVRAGNFWGCVDKTGKLIIPSEYEKITEIKDSFIIAVKNGYLGVLTKSNQVIIPFKYKKVNLENGFFIVKDSLARLYDRQGKLLLSNIYEEIYNPQENFVLASHKGKMGAVDFENNIVIPFEYDRISVIHRFLVIVEKSGSQGSYNLMGKSIIPAKYESIQILKGLKDTVFIANTGSDSILIYKLDGELLFPASVEMAGPYTDSMIRIKTGGKEGVINFRGQQILKPEYDFISPPYKSGIIEVSNNRVHGLISINGKAITPLKYDYVFRTNDSLFSVRANNIWSLINSDGKILAPVLYSKIEHVDGKYFGAIADRTYCFMNQSGKPFDNARYESIEDFRFFRKGTFQVYKDGKAGILNSDGTWLLKPQYSRIWDINNGYCKAKHYPSHLYSLIDSTGKSLTGSDYSEIGSFKVGSTLLFIISKEYKWGILDKDGKELTPCKYDKIEGDKFPLKVILNGKEGYIDSTGREIVPPIYVDADLFTYCKYRKKCDYFAVEVKIDPDSASEEDRRISGYSDKVIRRGAVDGNGKFLINPGPYFISYYGSTFILKNGERKCALASLEDKMLTPFVYDQISPIEFDDSGRYHYLDVYTAVRDKKIFLLNKHGEELNETGFERILTTTHNRYVLLYNRYLIVYQNSKAGLSDLNGKQVLPCEYDLIHITEDGFLELKENDYYFYCDMNGNTFFE